jgi:Transposase IS116/IS110/IS902 family
MRSSAARAGVAWASQAVADFPAHSLEQLLDAHPDGDLVRSMPGMGTTLSAEFLAEVVSIQQFPTGNALAAASGLAPPPDQRPARHPAHSPASARRGDTGTRAPLLTTRLKTVGWYWGFYSPLRRHSRLGNLSPAARNSSSRHRPGASRSGPADGGHFSASVVPPRDRRRGPQPYGLDTPRTPPQCDVPVGSG